MVATAVLERILHGLNDEQRQAVTSSHRGQLQIVAGPGTGKTKVLTARVAYLLVHHQIQPWQLIVTTFTRKAAKEMKDRLAELLKGSDVRFERLLIGTFHSICIRVLRRHAGDVGLDGKFFVASTKDTTDILDAFLEDLGPTLDSLRVEDEKNNAVRDIRSDKDSLVVGKIKRQISHLKSQGLWPEDYEKQEKHSHEVLKIYQEMHKRMQEMNMLDFDDILIYTVRLLRSTICLANIRHVLVDEFQDTNTVQMELVKLFASQNKHTRDNLTVVGDVDQSIYAFRGANAKNFKALMKTYTACQMIQLRENYRSTQDVLDASECFMREQKDRIHKNLQSQHHQRFPMVNLEFGSDYKEAQFIAKEVKFLKSLPGLYKAKDIAVLVRANYMTRVIEKELSSLGLPYSVVKGRAFWERKEVMAMIDLLKVFARRQDRCALMRALVNMGEGVGNVTVKRITTMIEEMAREGVVPIEVLRRLHAGELKISGMTSKAKSSCQMLVKMVEEAEGFTDPSDERDEVLQLFDYFFDTLQLQRIIGEDKEKKENVEEIRKQLEIFTPESLGIEPEADGDDDTDASAIDIDVDAPDLTFLEHFLNSIDIYSPDEVSEGESNKDPDDKVSISTIHSAKGLEWPVVFVVGLNNGQFPSGRTDDIKPDPVENMNEDRRVFYVSTTRAKHLFYVTSSSFQRSEFINPLRREKLTTSSQSAFTSIDKIKDLYRLAGAPEPSLDIIDKYKKYYDTLFRERSMESGEYGDFGGGYKEVNYRKAGFQYASGRASAEPEQPLKKGPQYAPKQTPYERPVNHTKHLPVCERSKGSINGLSHLHRKSAANGDIITGSSIIGGSVTATRAVSMDLTTHPLPGHRPGLKPESLTPKVAQVHTTPIVARVNVLQSNMTRLNPVRKAVPNPSAAAMREVVNVDPVRPVVKKKSLGMKRRRF